MSSRTRDGLALTLLFFTALALRLAYLIRYDEDIDSLRFALAVDRFDVLALQPHAPFYPVYVAAAKLVAGAGASPQIALGVVGAVAGAATVVATALLGREVVSVRGAYLAGALALASPFGWLSSTKLTSDAAGTALTTTALWLCARAGRLATGSRDQANRALLTTAIVILGVGLGVRLSYFPFALAVTVVVGAREGRWRGIAARTRDLAAGVVLWLVPLVIVAGPHPLVAAGGMQAAGHFTQWGGSVITVPSPTLRLAGLLWGAWANVLGGAWPDAPALRWIGAPVLIALGIAALARIRLTEVRHPELVAAAIAYVFWAALFQNVAYKPRHLLPLTPLLVVGLAAGADALIARARALAILPIALSLQWFVDGLALVRAHTVPSPAAALVAHLSAADDPRPIATREIGRMIASGAPSRVVVQTSNDAELLEALAPASLVTSEAMSAPVRASLAARGLGVRVAFTRPRSRYVDALWSDLALLEIE